MIYLVEVQLFEVRNEENLVCARPGKKYDWDEKRGNWPVKLQFSQAINYTGPAFESLIWFTTDMAGK